MACATLHYRWKHKDNCDIEELCVAVHLRTAFAIIKYRMRMLARGCFHMI